LPKNKKYVLGVVLLMLFTSAATYLGTSVYYNYFSQNSSAYSITYSSDTVKLDSINKFKQARDLLKKNYYEDVSEDTLLEGAVAGMADSLGDPYTVYFTKEQMDRIADLSATSEESYSGIGVSITMGTDGLVIIIEPFEGSPALAAGVKQGDKIIKINEEDVTGLKDENAIVDLIKGPENTVVNITVFRPSEDKSIDFAITRKKITVELNIRSSVLDSNIGYIRIISFLDNNLSSIFDEHLNKLLDSGIEGLIIDVRDDPGGSYDQVVDIADRLLPRVRSFIRKTGIRILKKAFPIKHSLIFLWPY
jgi:carboxyl-terminal processing protease